MFRQYLTTNARVVYEIPTPTRLTLTCPLGVQDDKEKELALLPPQDDCKKLIISANFRSVGTRGALFSLFGASST